MDWIEETGWVSPLGAGGLIALAVGAVALLLVLIIKFKMHAFLTLIIISVLTALVAGIPPEHVIDTLVGGFGGTLGNVALLVAIGAMLGSLVETSGGARALAERMIDIFGEKRAPFALGIAALIVGFPIFMDAAFVLMIPIVYAIARRLQGNLIAYGIPVAGALSVQHVYLPPQPGPVAATEFVEANLGIVLLLGLIVAFPIWYVSGYLWGMFAARRVRVDVAGAVFANPQEDTDPITDPPKPLTTILVVLLPVFLILLNTGLGALGSAGVVDPDAYWVGALQLLGATPIALLLSALVAILVLGLRTGKDSNAIERTVDGALGPVASVILITGAGGMFGGVLRATGIGDAITDSLAAAGIPLIIAAYVIAAALRLAQGSATVALTTAAALVAPGVIASDLGTWQLACIVLSLAAGSVVAGHVNDSGFWLVGRLLNMDVPTTLKVWTVQQTFQSLVALVIALVVYAVIGMF
ncbi:MAG: GntP family permease [Brachybacterium sp.]|nr:GntP family permease [Brachybacterium sp.]